MRGSSLDLCNFEMINTQPFGVSMNAVAEQKISVNDVSDVSRIEHF